MRIFVSWSGIAAEKCAEELRNWLPYINPMLEPFVSSQDIAKGERGLPKIASELQGCSFGLVCVTRDNQAAPWINFESGALSRELGESMLAPFLLDLPVKDLEGPLTQFQATDSRKKEDVWALVTSINEKCETRVEQNRLRVTFDRFWGDLDSKLSEIRKAEPESSTPVRETADILDELVSLVREQSSRLQNLELLANRAGVTYRINEPREVFIEDTRPSAPRDQVHAAEKALTDLIEPGNIIRIVARRDNVVVALCTPTGYALAKEFESRIGAICSTFKVSIVVETTADHTKLQWDYRT
ncbi:hypothetical protein [Streptomyces sp. NPDC005283]|uniref:hypothetical protein n=1 Tax=Streptomyces sp. NPDC005283 TaxID=3156871 RepID=UPI00345492DF